VEQITRCPIRLLITGIVASQSRDGNGSAQLEISWCCSAWSSKCLHRSGKAGALANVLVDRSVGIWEIGGCMKATEIMEKGGLTFE